MNKQKIINLLLFFSIIGVIVSFFTVSPVFALETKTIYSVNNNGTLASANSYNYGYLTGGGTQGSSRANVNTTVSGVAYGFNFQFYENVVLNKTYTLVINFMDIDLLKTFNSSMVQISTCNSTTCNENTLVSVVKSNNNGNSNKLTIEFNPITTGPIILVNLGSDQPITGVSTFGIKSVTLDSTNQNQEIIDNQTNNTNNIINNNNSNTQEIIDSSASNTEQIINNQNQNTQDIIDSKYSCNLQIINLYNYVVKDGYLTSIGSVSSNSSYQTTSFIKIKENTNYEIALNYTMGSPAYCLYDNKQELISCTSFSSSTSISFNSSSANFVKISLRKDTNNSRTSTLYGNICLNDSEEQTNAINDLNDSINDDDVDSSSATSFFSNFNDNTHGLSGIISAPLTAINSMLNNQCSPLTATWKNKTISLNCGYEFWQRLTGFKEFLNIALDGLLCYRILVKIFKLVENLKNPNDDRVEVMDL